MIAVGSLFNSILTPSLLDIHLLIDEIIVEYLLHAETDLKLKIKVCISNFQNLQSKKENKDIQHKYRAKWDRL